MARIIGYTNRVFVWCAKCATKSVRLYWIPIFSDDDCDSLCDHCGAAL